MKRLVGSTWEFVGPQGFSDGQVDTVTVAFDGTDVPYVAYAGTNVLAVQRWNSTAWEDVGALVSTDGNIPVMALDKRTGYIYLFYRNTATTKGRVQWWNGSTWAYLGPPDFTANLQNGGTGVALNSAGLPYVTYIEQSGSNIVTQGWNGTDWNILGPSPGSGQSPSIAFDSTDTLYWAFGDNANGGKAVVLSWNGTGWSHVGPTAITTSQAIDTVIHVNSYDVPYLAYKDTGMDRRLSAQKWNGTAWDFVGDQGFSPSRAGYISLDFDLQDNPTVSFRDYDYSQSGITVEQFG